jgi:hypothetical protein
MVSSVNKTSLHPSGVVPSKEHTEIEEELHEKANIDFDHVAIIPNPSVAVLYEDALVYETGSAITSSGALTAYSGAKTGRSPLDKRIVKEEGSEKNVWWGPVNKPMTPEVFGSVPTSQHMKLPLVLQLLSLFDRDSIDPVAGFPAIGYSKCGESHSAELFQKNLLAKTS